MEDENLNMEGNDSIKEPKKKGSIGIIILMIILMIGCLVGGYFLNESGVFSKDKKTTEEKNKKEKEEEKEPVVTNYDVTDSKVANLILDLLRGYDCNAIDEFVKDKKVESSDISNKRAFNIAEWKFVEEKTETITLDEFTNKVKIFLGKDYNFDPSAINYQGSSCPNYNYDSNTKVFTKQETACGGTCGPMTVYNVVKAVDTDGILKLDVKIVFASSETALYYSDYARTNKIGEFGEDVKQLYSKGSDYKFTFKLEDGNYVFVSSEPVK